MVIRGKRCEEMRSYTVYEPASQVKILNTVLMEEKLLKEIITRNAPNLGEEMIFKKSRYRKIQSHNSYLIQNGLHCDIAVKLPDTTGSWRQQEKDAQPHTKGSNFTIKTSVETWHPGRMGWNDLVNVIRGKTKTRLNSKAVLQTCHKSVGGVPLSHYSRREPFRMGFRRISLAGDSCTVSRMWQKVHCDMSDKNGRWVVKYRVVYTKLLVPKRNNHWAR